MGLYLNITPDGEPLPAKGKALALIAVGARPVAGIFTWDKSLEDTLVCVVENPSFDAAAVCTDRSEYNRFCTDRSGRPKTWLIFNGAGKLAREGKL